jgi:hypothetical protein
MCGRRVRLRTSPSSVRGLSTKYGSLNGSACHLETMCPSETSVDFQRTTRRYIPEDSTLHQWFSTFIRPRDGKFFFYKTRARYRAAARRLKNTALHTFYRIWGSHSDDYDKCYLLAYKPIISQKTEFLYTCLVSLIVTGSCITVEQTKEIRGTHTVQAYIIDMFSINLIKR